MAGRGRTSAGIVLFRRSAGGIEILIGHPGGPFWSGRDAGHWTIPKGEADEGETEVADRDAAGSDGTVDGGRTDLLRVARREFREETGHEAPDGPALALGWIRQKSGKRVHAWALEGDLDPASARSNTFELEWPPRSARMIEVPELDRVAWVTPAEARRLLKEAQVPLVDRLEDALAER